MSPRRSSSPFAAQLRAAQAVGGGRSGRSKPRVRSKSDFLAEFELADTRKSTTVPELDMRAMAEEPGAKKAQQAYQKLMDSELDQATKDKVTEFYKNAGGKLPGEDDGLLHKLTHNPVTNAIGTAMQVIDKPKRVVAGGIDELQELLFQSEDGKSFKDNVLRAESYGFGDVWENAKRIDAETGGDGKLFGLDIQDNQWLGRGVGLAGDLAGDPLNYMGVGVVTKAADGAAGGARMTAKAIARRFADAGMEEEAALVLRRGIGAAKAADLEKVGLEGGIKFSTRGKGGPSLRVGAHDGVSKLRKPLGLVREAAGDSKLARTLQKGLGADELADFRIIMRDRGATPAEAVNAMKHFDSVKTGVRQSARFGALRAQELEPLLTEARTAGVPGDVIKGAISGDLAKAVELERLMPGGTAKFRAWHKAVREEGNRLGAGDWIKDAGDDYYARFLTDEAKDVVAAKSARKGTGLPSFEQRAAKSGDEFGDEVLGSDVLHEQFSPGMVPGSRAAIEAQMAGLIAEWGGPAKVFTDDAYEDLPRYLKGVTHRVGHHAETADLLKRGVVTEIPVTMDRAATEAAARKAEKGVAKASKVSRKATKAALRDKAKLDDALARIAESNAGLATARTQAGTRTQLLDNLGAKVMDDLPPEPDAARVAALVGERPGIVEQIKSLGKQTPEEQAAAVLGRQVGTREGNIASALEEFNAPDAVAARQAALATADTAAQSADAAELLARNMGAPASVRRPLVAAKDRTEKSLLKLTERELNGPPKVVKARAELADLKPRFETATEAARMARTANADTIATATQRLVDVETELAGLKAAGSARAKGLALAADFYKRRIKVVEELVATESKYAKDMLALEAQRLGLEADAALSGREAWTSMEDFARQLGTPKGAAIFKQQLQEGFSSMAEYGLQDMQLPAYHFEALNRAVEVANDPNKFRRFVEAFNRSFKTYAVLTPGFHVRNSMGATFNNFVAGVDASSYREVGRNLGKFRKGGIEAVDASIRPIFQQLEESGGIIWESTNVTSELGLHGNETGRLFKRPQGPVNNVVTRGSQKMGTNVEHFQRFTLAYDAMKKGATLDEALDMVAQFHFDYTDLSSLERNYAKQIVPFWTWTSRNLPLQLEMVYRSPQTYQKFNALKKNLTSDDQDMTLVPSWIKNAPSAIPLGGDNFLTPDMPFSGVDEQLQGLRQGPLAMLQDTTPLVKTPVELMFGKQAWQGIPISDKHTEMPKAWQIIPGLAPALMALGPQHAVRSKDGRIMLSNRTAYTLEQAMPLFGRFRRLFPSAESAAGADSTAKGKYEERRVAAWLSFMGVGFRHVTERDRQNESWRLADQLEASVTRAETRGVKFNDSRSR